MVHERDRPLLDREGDAVSAESTCLLLAKMGWTKVLLQAVI